MCSWKGLLLLAYAASLVVNVASDDVQIEAAAQSTIDTQATGETGETATTEPTADTQAIEDTADTSFASCGRPPRCRNDEVYTDCKNVSCTMYSCSELGFPIKCDSNCKPGCVCKDYFLRTDDGKCVSRDQCPSCGGDPNAGPGCGSYCINCSNYKKKPAICPLGCIYNGCQCKDGFIYDRNIKKCVVPSQCTPTCGANEVYSDCTNGGCSPRDCSDIGKSFPCVRPKVCLKGCVCAPGYLRASNGTCVPKDQCEESKCKANEVYDVCPAPCPPRRCDVDDRLIKCAAPPKPGDPACRPGCRCTDGYARNATGSCVLRSQCEKPIKCKANEVYDRCPGICPPQECGVNPALILCLPNPEYGDPRCQPGCKCVDGYVHDADGVCIPKDQCPPKCGDNEVYSTCTNGGCDARNCSQVGKPVPCVKLDPKSCIKGCVCAAGYLRDSDGTCVPKDQCPPTCGANEVYSICTNGGCDARNCSQVGKPVPCVKLDPKSCIKGCVCAKGYLRDSDGKCVPKDQCPTPSCPNGEIYNQCPTVKCEGDYCPKTRDSPQTCPVGIVCDPPRCTCGFNQKRDRRTGKCIATSNCPPFVCNGPNEEYQPCPATCPGENCSDYINDTKCPRFKIGIVVPCRPQCKCKTGYYRNDKGVCILGCECGPKKSTTTTPPVVITTTTPAPTETCTGQNEFFDTCIKGCSTQTCDSIGKIFNCPIETTVCKTGCRCITNFYRNDDNVCVPESQCPTPSCPDGEVYNRCPTVKCDGDYCPKTRDSPQTCPVGIVCDPPRCTCGFNQKRDWKTRKCIPTRNCPPFPCNGRNEEYQPCPVNCPGENCSDYINDSKCPPGRIGIVLQCRPQCKCKPGFYRNSDGVCIIGRQCGPKQSATTITPVVITTPSPNGGDGNPGNSGDGVAALLAGITKFTGQFLYDRIKASKGDNIIISAYSVFTPLAQLALYAGDESLKQLLTVLNVKSKDDIRTAFPALTESYEGQTNVTFNTATKVYCNDKYPLSEGLKKDSVNIFHAEGEDVDFSKNIAAAAKINAWVESKTNNRIKDLVSPDLLSSLTRLVLVNAIYFKGDWLYAFDKKNTKDADFYLSDGSTKQTKLMYQKANFNYGEIEDLNCKALEMFYQGKNFSMVIVLPNNNNGVIDLADKLRDPANFYKVYGSLRSQKVEVYVPPFEITTTTDLAEILKQQNVRQIFNPQNSGLSGLLKKPEDVYVSSAIQKAFIKSDETGSEAAAANAVVISTRALPLPPPEPKVFRADKAFLFYIKLKTTVLFAGVING